MKKELLLGVLIAYAPVVSAKDLLEIEITSGIRSKQNEVVVPARIEVITRQEIEEGGAAHISDVLRGRGTIQITDTFGDGSRSSIGMRGFGDTDNANTLVLVDGRRLNNMDIAGPDLNSVSLKDIERIEIIHGSATVLYGDQAAGGVINIITRKASHAAASIELGMGSYGGNRILAQAAQPLTDRLSVRISGERRETDGYRDHNELDYENLFGLMEYRHDQGRLFSEIQTTDESLHTPGALYIAEAEINRRSARPEYLSDYIDTKTEVFRAGISQRLTPEWRFEGEWTYRESDGEFLQSARNAPETIPATQRRRVNSLNPRLIGSFPLSEGTLIATLGYDYDDARYRLNSRFGIQNNDQQVSSWYGQVIIPLNDKLRTTLGARHSRVENEVRDDFTFPEGQDINDDLTAHELGIEYRPDNHWRLYARRADNFRFAKVDEYLSPMFGTTTIIDNQTGRSLEAGVEYIKDSWQMSLQVYEMDLDNEIIFDPVNFANINLDKTQREGMSLDVQYQLSRATDLEFGLNVVDASVTSGAFSGNNVPMVADYTSRLGIRHQFGPHWSLYGEVQSISDRPYSGDFNNQLNELDGYRVANVNVKYQRKNWRVDFRVNNLFDEEYADFGALNNEFLFVPPFIASFESIQPSPERNFWLSVRYDF